MKYYEIIIIGAGAAGLIAAHELSKAGKKVIILEAKDRIGGRIHTFSDDNFMFPVELGAEFVHGDLPITDHLLKEAKIKYSRVMGKMLSVNDGGDNGNDFSAGWDILDEKLKAVKEDMSIQDFLNTYFGDEKYTRLRSSIKGFAEGYDTANISIASVIAFRDEWLSEEESKQYRIDGGYQKLMDYLHDESISHECKIKLSSIVKEINWRPGKVEVKTEAGDRFSADQVIVTVPLGILTANKNAKAFIKFTPDILPQLEAAKKIGYGYVVKILIEFDNSPWNDKATEKRMGVKLDKLSFLFSSEFIPTWWTQYPKESTLLTGWIGGYKAEELKSVDEKTIYEKAVLSLSNIFKLPINDLKKKIKAHKIINWSAEAFTLGSYSYSTLETVEARKILTTPLNNTLYFAGEALYEGPEMGTVEAALSSGLKTAKTIVKNC